MKEKVKAILEKYCDLQNGEKIVVDDGPQEELIFSVWSETVSQNEVEKLKLKISPLSISKEDYKKLKSMGLIYYKAMRAWIH